MIHLSRLITKQAHMQSITFSLCCSAVLFASSCIHSVLAWELPLDKGTLPGEAISEILAGNRYPETSSYHKQVFFEDFTSYGKTFTQVVIRLTPDNPRRRNGRKLVVVAAAPGSEYGRDFITTVEGREAMGPWLARHGITFIALTRVGRWNFLDDDGSWENIPIDDRMPVFDRNQKRYWSAGDYTKQKSDSGEVIARHPRPGTRLYEQMLAATPVTLLKGYRIGLERALPQGERNTSTVLFWGMSTGGAFVWPLAEYYKPDGYLGYGTSSTGLAYLYRTATEDDFDNPYVNSFLRVRQRGFDDFERYTAYIDAATRKAWWRQALKNPRFKSVEDAMMKFNIAALSEQASRLWMADFLPAYYREQGFSKFVKDILDAGFPPENIGDIPALEVNGTLDEAQPPATVDAHRAVMEHYVARYRVARIEGFHHYLFTRDMIKVVGSLWLRFIDAGYFDKGGEP